MQHRMMHFVQYQKAPVRTVRQKNVKHGIENVQELGRTCKLSCMGF